MQSNLPYPPAIQRLEGVVQILLASTYLTAAADVVLLYDHILTLPDEIEYVWSSPLSVAVVMFYLNRYVPIPVVLFGVFHLSHFHEPQSTTVAILIQPIGEAISYVAASWVLMLRVIALYKRNPSLAFLLYGLLATTHMVALALVVRIVVRIWPSLQYSQTFDVCVSDSDIRDFSMIYFTLLPFEVVLIILQIYHLSGHRHVVKLSGGSQPSMLKTIYMDGLIYFIVIFCLRLWAGFTYAFADASLFYIATWTEFAFGATTVSRLFLRLRHNARAAEGDSVAAQFITEPFSKEFGIYAPNSASSTLHLRSSRLRSKGRATSFSSILTLESLWTKEVIGTCNNSDDVVTTMHGITETQPPLIRPERPLPPIPSYQSIFMNAWRPSHIRSATF